VSVGHVAPVQGPTVYRGHLVVEPRRHAPGLGDLTDDEAAAVGRLCNQAASLLRAVAGAEHVYAFVMGDAVPHLHVQLVPRYPGTPREHWGPLLTRWADGPRLQPAEVESFVAGLRDGFGRLGRFAVTPPG
jgi:diadenosine tetraphosphate (Ap4A) HIT family hydrolase